MSSKNKMLMRRWFEEVWNQGKAEAADSMLMADARIYGLVDDPIGPDGFKIFHSKFRSAFPDVRIEVKDMLEEGNLIAVRFTCKGTYRGTGLDVPTAKAGPVSFDGMAFAIVDGDRVTKCWNVIDQAGMLKQLGAF